MRLRKKKREHHQRLLGATGSEPGTNQPPRGWMSTSVKHPSFPSFRSIHSLPAQQPMRIWPGANLPDQADPGRVYKRAHSSISKESTARSRRDNFSRSTLSFCSKRSHRDYFAGSPYWAINKNQYMTGPPREAISVSQSDSTKETDPVQTPPHAALPDVSIDVGLEPPKAAATSRIPREDRPPVVLEIPTSTTEPSEPRQCPDTPGKWFRPPAWGSKGLRSTSPLSPRRPRKHSSSFGR